MGLDIKLFYFLNNLAGQSCFFDALVIFFAKYFQYFLGAFFLTLLFFWKYPRQKKFHIFLTAFISAAVARFGITEIIRFLYHRPRPFLIHQVNEVLSSNEWSFPSGHSAFFFAMAVAIYFYNKKWGIAFFVAAILMNISRVIAGIHYPSDILGGMIVGSGAAILIYVLILRVLPRGRPT